VAYEDIMSHVAASVSFIGPFPFMMVRGGTSIQAKSTDWPCLVSEKNMIIDDNELPRQIK
jgi:hypothetical protein